MKLLKNLSFILLSFSILLVGIWHLYLEDYQKQRIQVQFERLTASQSTTS